MNSILITIDPKQATIDLPIDEANKREIERQALAWKGIHTPIEIWIKDDELRKSIFADPSRITPELVFLIMDGFHRTSVAIALGMAAIPALLYDCTEAEFWDKRISQAKKHHVVKDDRLHAWMLYAWGASPFAGQERTQRFVDTIHLIHQYLIGSTKVKLDKNGNKLLDWFRQKAELWGRKPVDVAKIVLEKEKVLSPQFPEASALASEIGLDAAQTAKLTKSFPKGNRAGFGRGLTKTEMKRYAQEVVSTNADITPEDWKKRQEAKRHRDHQRQAAFLETPAGIEEKRKRRVENGVEAVNGLRIVEHRLSDLMAVDLNELLIARPDMLDKINGFVQKVNNLCALLRNGVELSMPESEIPALKRRIADLEAQLKVRPASVVVGADSMVVHSHG